MNIIRDSLEILRWSKFYSRDMILTVTGLRMSWGILNIPKSQASSILI